MTAGQLFPTSSVMQKRVSKIFLIENIDTYDKAMEAAAHLSSLGLGGTEDAYNKALSIFKNSLGEEGINFKDYKYLCLGIVSTIEDRFKAIAKKAKEEVATEKPKISSEILEDVEISAIKIMMKPISDIKDTILSRYSIGKDVEFGEEYTVYNFSDKVKLYLHRKEYKASLVVEGETVNRIDLNDFDTKEFYKWIKKTEKGFKQNEKR